MKTIRDIAFPPDDVLDAAVSREKARIGKLRKLAENNPSEHEATAAREKADELQARLSADRRGNQKKKELPRGLRWRGDSIVAVFALADGTIERRTLGEVSVSWALEQAAIYRRQVREGCYQKKQPRVKETTTLGDFWKMYLKGYKLAGKKAAWRQEMGWAHLKGTFEKMRPEQLTTAALIAYQEARRAEGAAAATVNRELSALSAALYYVAQMTGEGGKPLLAHVPIFPAKLKESAPRSGFIGDKEYAILAANAKPLWLRALIAVAYSFGFRKGELLNLCVRQIDFFGRWLELEHGTTKNGQSRKVHMTAETFALLKACAEGKNPDDYVFTRDDGSRVCDPRDEWYALCVASGLGEYVPAKRANGKDYKRYVGLNLHDFRRTAIRTMLRRGVPQNVAMRISGHKTAEVFRRYDILNESDLIEATRKIELGGKFSEGEPTSTKTDTSVLKPSSQSSQIPRN